MGLKIDGRARATLELLGIDNARTVEVDEGAEVPEWVVELWKERGYEVGRVGCMYVLFFAEKGRARRIEPYTYPLHLGRKARRKVPCKR